MSYHQLDKIADSCDPLLAIVLIVMAFATLKAAVWPFLLRNGLAFVVVQQTSKYLQKHGHSQWHWSDRFPSTHFAVALVLAVGIVVLNRRVWPYVLAFLLAYAYLMVPIQHYHTVPEMLGALFAVPVGLLFNWKFGSKQPLQAN